MTTTNETVERIVSAAIEYNGQCFTGWRHAKIFPIVLMTGCTHISQNMQGFVTDRGRFVNRVQARKIARKAGQISEKTLNSKTLFSEDLWTESGAPLIQQDLKSTK